jgi:hypothetical protein
LDLFESNTLYTNWLIQVTKQVDDRCIVHLHFPSLQTLKLQTNEDYVKSGGEINTVTKLLRVEKYPKDVEGEYEDATQLELSQSFGRLYDRNKEIVCLLSLPHLNYGNFSKAHVISLLD